MKRNVKRHVPVQPLEQPYRLIPLTQGKNAIIDIGDYRKLSRYNWQAHWNKCVKSFYAKRGDKNWKTIYMHTSVLGRKPGKQIDHINHDTLDNRKGNLRRCTRSQNLMNVINRRRNKSGYVGVSLHARSGKWRMRIGKGPRFEKFFDSVEQAAHAYDQFARQYYGPFAHLNFPA